MTKIAVPETMRRRFVRGVEFIFAKPTFLDRLWENVALVILQRTTQNREQPDLPDPPSHSNTYSSEEPSLLFRWYASIVSLSVLMPFSATERPYPLDDGEQKSCGQSE